MKNSIQRIIVLMLISFFGFANAQGELTPGVQTSSVAASISNWVSSTSDKNKAFYASAYWLSGEDCANYLKIYNGNTFASTSPQVLISTYHGFTRVRLDHNNNVYVLYVDRTSPGSTTFRTYLKKYNTAGALIGSRIEVANNTNVTDIEVAPNGDVLIGCVEGTLAKVKIFRNMIYKGYLPISNVPKISNSSPFSIQMDMKDSKFVVGYSLGSITSSELHIKRYTYNPTFSPFSSFNLSSQYSHYTEYGSRFERDNNQIALRSNWEVFYNANTSTSYPFVDFRVKYLNSGGSSIFQYSKGFVDIDINNRLLISKNHGSINYPDYKINLYNSSNSLIHEFSVSNKIKNHLESLAIYDCEFVITGIDRKLGANPLSHTYQSYHQLFNCQDCRPNMGATAVAKFRYPNAVNQYPSKYGPLDVTELCLVDNLLVDGSLSSCEDRYYVELTEFNPVSWTDTLVLHSAWVTPITQAPNNINIVDFLPPGYHLRPGKIYKFKLAVGSPWDSTEIFFEVTCCKRDIVVIGNPQEVDEVYKYSLTFGDDQMDIREEAPVNFSTFPNPAKEELTLDFSNFSSTATKAVSIKNVKGIEVYSNKISSEKETVTVKKWPTGIYITTVIIDGKTYQKKIIKQ
ncbi:T9SS type A sorting domain-containing protein [Winogradskyella sp. SM1960]|uniref:T9SS type A sorting domain-containing protein n=1 Tax=Winogradskyella sp. SM1960 TaxID=2865955 RepID=UPI001CD4AF2A|nr:T9SS type A sorting domain-containing protein [Winogradskyella sp. SM1960]